MATSGSKSVSVTSWDTLKFSWTAGTQSVANNTTPVSWKMELVSTSSGKIDSSATKKWSVNVNGTNYSGTNTIGIGNNTTKTLASGTTNIVHNADGTKTFNFSFSQQFDITFDGAQIGTITGSGSGTLNTIARASQPSCVTWPEHTQNVGEFGGPPISIHMNRKSDSFTHTVRYAFGDLSGVIAREVTTGTTWTIPLSFMDKIPNATKGSGTIYVDTYSGTTFVGTKYCGFTATVPETVTPSVRLTLEDVTGVNDIYGKHVQGLSIIKVTPTITQAYSSPIQNCTITIDGSTYNKAEAFTHGPLQKAMTSKVTAQVTDARGRRGTWEYSMDVLHYSRPRISRLSVHRTNADGTENEQGDHVTVAFSASITSLQNKNTADYTLRFKKKTDSQWTSWALDAADGNFDLVDHEVTFPADVDYSYYVEITATDRHYSDKRGTSASTAFSLMDWHSSGTGIAFGKASARENTMEVGLPFYLLGGITPIEIEEGADLNGDRYKIPGWYRCSLSATAETLQNKPDTEKAFTMEVLPNAPATQRITEYVQDYAPRIFIRNYYDHLDTWGEWYEITYAQNRFDETFVNLIDMGQYDAYVFPSDGYLVLRAHYSLGSYVNCRLTSTNMGGFRLTACSGTTFNMVGNPTCALFVRKGMRLIEVDTNDRTKNNLEFHPVF